LELNNTKPVIRTLEGVIGFLNGCRTGEEGVFVILIGGCSRTGKTTLANTLRSALEKNGETVIHIGMDAWLVSVEQRPHGSRVIDRYDVASMTRDIRSALAGNILRPPVYDAVTRRRTSEAGPPVEIDETGFLIIEGVVALAVPELRDLAHVKLAASTDDGIRIRRLMSFYTDYKGFSVTEAEALIAEREKEEVPFIKDHQRYADFICETTSMLSEIV
jgi:uridine kinase